MLDLPRTDARDAGTKDSCLFYQTGSALPTAERGEGIYIWDTKGKKYLDACSGSFAANLGHGDRRMLKAAEGQMEKISFAYRTQFENEPANELSRFLVSLSPDHLKRVFLVNSGSEAVEACMKLARQYWWARGQNSKAKFISRRPSYHGATLGALSLTSYHDLNAPFEPLTVKSPKVSAPFCYRCPLGKTYPSCKTACADELEEVINEVGAENIAAFVTEPIGGASTGGAVPPDEWFPMIEATCRKHNILLIVDEVLTGCGRTGAFYGFEHWGIKPDLVAVAKGLSAGYAPVGACLAREEIVEVVVKNGGFMHGHTLAGNPLASAVALQALKIVVEDRLVENAKVTGQYLQVKLRALKEKYAFIGDVRGKGLLAGIEFVSDKKTKEPFPKEWNVGGKATGLARARGLLIYPRRSIFGISGDHVSLAPPLIIDKTGVDEIITLLEATLTELGQWLQMQGQKHAATG
ncbi:MAG: aminotransferase class III-fold pyridoxal phosphate-dependent enzyme [Alphaproteobacteria bacterium]|nr:MAG: aminotransferase class III-fold pyridoxal phosphate-dependent enzyme [Alphaproteobacteria bacterium]